MCSQAGVLGATGGLGSVVVHRLLDDAGNPTSKISSVKAFVRDPERAKSSLPCDSSALSLTKLPPVDDVVGLREAFRGVSYLVVCVGTTAFPTRAWRNGNTPSAIDDFAVSQWMKALDAQAIRRIVYVSSIGVLRRLSFPYFILNAYGVLDAKLKGESHVVEAARRLSCAYAILRPGRLVGAPHTNIGALRKAVNLGELNVRCEKGDCVNGSVSRATTAAITAISLVWDTSKNLDICFVNTKGEAPSQERLEEKVRACEVVATRNVDL